jgi:hypothetical protein
MERHRVQLAVGVTPEEEKPFHEALRGRWCEK